ncbi:MAG TPA: cyclic nucleotide-binding domain-containing protein, partial [Mycobacterium sp.]|nr:cyclic nucleotide-binding domain-containing protein [Mycobacterium sp.]
VSDELAGQGERVLALAWQGSPSLAAGNLGPEDLPHDLVLLGLIGLLDPPRKEAIEAVAECHQGGIRVTMITGDHKITVDSTFSTDDPPDGVCALLVRTAAALPQCRPDARPTAVALGGDGYRTSIPLRSPADDGAARATFNRWLWYAARRAEYHLDGTVDDFGTEDRRAQALRDSVPILRLTPADQRELVGRVRILRYGADEVIQGSGAVPQSMKFVVAGQVRLAAVGPDGSTVTVRTLEEGDFLGQTALTREPVTAYAVALDEVTVVEVDREDVEALVRDNPALLQEIARAIEERRGDLRRVLAAIHPG